MCLIVIAHRTSERFPLIIAANRDEEYARPTVPADFWSAAFQAAVPPARRRRTSRQDAGAPNGVLGGRDALLGGSWLAIAKNGRFAAVTNLHGAIRSLQSRSRGELVREFVVGAQTPRHYADDVARRIDQYSGFHLFVGEIGGDLMLISGSAQPLGPGIHGLSNAPNGERWPKVDTAVTEIDTITKRTNADQMADEILRFLGPPMKHRDPTRDVFIAGDRYGTRSSTAIVADGPNVLFIEQNYDRGGTPIGERREFRFAPSLLARLSDVH